jgi:hypothetical protein
MTMSSVDTADAADRAVSGDSTSFQQALVSKKMSAGL